MQIILNHKLQYHIWFLRRIRILFRKYDAQNMGFVNLETAKNLLTELVLPESVKLYEVYDRLNLDKLARMTFSDFVDGLASFLVDSEGEKITLLQWHKENS